MMVDKSMPALSIILIAHNMERELPRTLKSFSPPMQQGLSVDDYELIVVDNGSRRPFRQQELEPFAPNVRVLDAPDPTPSPVAAIHQGLVAAKGELIGVCIDGARMASPGLLVNALAASQLHPKPVIGTLAFHLGFKVQMESVLEGYSQEVEDTLLARCDWEKDGYRLFQISSFAGSSAEGWFELPAEANALFLKRSHWRDLNGGYDIRFRTPGGGLANLDLWHRLAEDATSGLIMLLGEATFHQVHGGVATNALESPWAEFSREYRAIRGVEYKRPVRRPLLYGAFNAESASHIERFSSSASSR
ncbi:glycosyltransferase family A protein [Methylocella tundrae]|nr:glycosyltransferase family A protein [Methylocella tundrae]